MLELDGGDGGGGGGVPVGGEPMGEGGPTGDPGEDMTMEKGKRRCELSDVLARARC